MFSTYIEEKRAYMLLFWRFPPLYEFTLERYLRVSPPEVERLLFAKKLCILPSMQVEFLTSHQGDN